MGLSAGGTQRDIFDLVEIVALTPGNFCINTSGFVFKVSEKSRDANKTVTVMG